MDYKNRIPGYRPPRPPRRKDRSGLWAGLAAVGVLVVVAIGWAVTRPKEAATTPMGPPEPPRTPSTVSPAPQPTPPATGQKPPVPTIKPEPAATTAVKPPEPRFSFYKLLPEQEAVVPENEIKTLKREESMGKKAAVQYSLQAGSFANAQDAEKLKAKLSALHIKSRIETVKIESTVWNRVKIGPFNNMAEADQTRVYLRKNQLDSVIQKAVSPTSGAPATKPAGR
jgi:cell division protein FtsN